ncbi:uncharacterized protein C8Q71DRAFT_798968 [Rhodofomes roseus]|uniref:SWI/SNF and RSC complexes subunit Ssr4 N-terminal domain-containing protein n=1 Tax=Rhodofomes roseus TaxID=34475 RepID=A0ABQ8K3C2_9APHY|nr:uncharacterized protein C8Q71DRAFT_798968 [Rhodofomes roseus]KAH9831353.1 hypothetical protein C8Q71DRAFT_798968 [Rhodofomes roseus]
MSVSSQHEGLCLRYPEPLGPHANVTYEVAVSMLLRAIQLAQHTPFVWGYIDKPQEGHLYLIFMTQQLPFPPDGIRYQDQEQKMIIPAGPGRELEIMEIKFGFIPNSTDTTACRVRRRYRMNKGGHPQLVLIHYGRGQPMSIMPNLNQPVRNYPLRPIHEPALFVVGEKMGQKVYPNQHPGSAERPGPPGMGIGFGGIGNSQAMLAQQNSNLEALERRSQRDRSASMNARAPPPARVEDDDSADESDMISTRTLAMTRYKRNHEFMNEVFMYAAFSHKKGFPPPKSPYSVFNKTDVEATVTKFSAEIDELRAKAEARREARSNADGAVGDESGDVSMDAEEVAT